MKWKRRKKLVVNWWIRGKIEVPATKKQKIVELEGGVQNKNNNGKDEMAEIIEVGEVMWEACANKAISGMEQMTESFHIKELLSCFDVKDAGKRHDKFSK